MTNHQNPSGRAGNEEVGFRYQEPNRRVEESIRNLIGIHKRTKHAIIESYRTQLSVEISKINEENSSILVSKLIIAAWYYFVIAKENKVWATLSWFLLKFKILTCQSIVLFLYRFLKDNNFVLLKYCIIFHSWYSWTYVQIYQENLWFSMWFSQFDLILSIFNLIHFDFQCDSVLVYFYGN